MHENLIQLLRHRQEAFPFRRDLDLRHFLADAIGEDATRLPIPAKIFLSDELRPAAFGFPLATSPAVTELEKSLQTWIGQSIDERGRTTEKTRAMFRSYFDQLLKLDRNAAESSVLADYHAAFWLLHSHQAGRLFAGSSRAAADHGIARDEADRLRYAIHGRWLSAIRDGIEQRGFLKLVSANALLSAEDFISPDLRELRGYFTGFLQRDFNTFRKSFDTFRATTGRLLSRDRLLLRALSLLGYPESPAPHLIALLDPRVAGLLSEHPGFDAREELKAVSSVAGDVLQALIVQILRRGIVWIRTTKDGENIGEDAAATVYSRAIRPMNFGRRGVVEPLVFRYGLVYDITSFTETLGEIARGGRGEEQSSYRQMLEFQRQLAEITREHGLQFEKFLGDGAFYTSRRATRTIQAAIAIQRFYSSARARGFAFNKGMRIAVNYGYYRLLPMQVTAEGAQIIEFYGPGIVELSRLTTGKATKEIEDIQHLLLGHGYDQNEVYRFFAPLSRGVDRVAEEQQREFYAYINESGHLINEGIVVSIPFVTQLADELAEDEQKLYRLRTADHAYLGFPANGADSGYVGVRLLGAVQLKGIGSQDIAEVVWLAADEAEISIVDESHAFLQLLQQERNRDTASRVDSTADDVEIGLSDLVVCAGSIESGAAPVILVGEWDPVSEEVRRPIRLDEIEAERYGLQVPLTVDRVESQSLAYQKLYRRLSRLETLPNFSAGAIRQNQNFSGFIIGATVEPL